MFFSWSKLREAPQHTIVAKSAEILKEIHIKVVKMLRKSKYTQNKVFALHAAITYNIYILPLLPR